MMTRAEIHQHIVEIFVNSFELEPQAITLEANLFEELDLDSIDAIDLFVELSKITGRRVDAEVARELRTVTDLIAFVEAELAKGPD